MTQQSPTLSFRLKDVVLWMGFTAAHPTIQVSRSPHKPLQLRKTIGTLKAADVTSTFEAGRVRVLRASSPGTEVQFEEEAGVTLGLAQEGSVVVLGNLPRFESLQPGRVCAVHCRSSSRCEEFEGALFTIIVLEQSVDLASPALEAKMVHILSCSETSTTLHQVHAKAAMQSRSGTKKKRPRGAEDACSPPVLLHKKKHLPAAEPAVSSTESPEPPATPAAAEGGEEGGPAEHVAEVVVAAAAGAATDLLRAEVGGLQAVVEQLVLTSALQTARQVVRLNHELLGARKVSAAVGAVVQAAEAGGGASRFGLLLDQLARACTEHVQSLSVAVGCAQDALAQGARRESLFAEAGGSAGSARAGSSSLSTAFVTAVKQAASEVLHAHVEQCMALQDQVLNAAP